ncbi:MULTISPECIES: hypothetical protein [unclassified Sutcliffiella]|uniref:hypothetical protein n=1 Tax=unclassified Sutcliffiella TaxID=2837532 RepID=UPI0030D25BE9
MKKSEQNKNDLSIEQENKKNEPNQDIDPQRETPDKKKIRRAKKIRMISSRAPKKMEYNQF